MNSFLGTSFKLLLVLLQGTLGNLVSLFYICIPYQLLYINSDTQCIVLSCVIL